MSEQIKMLESYDATALVGLRVMVANTAHEITEDDGEVSIDIPDIDSLMASAAVARCLMPIRLQGAELRAVRKIAGWTAIDLALKMGEKTSHETISRWENDKQLMGGYAEKVLRLVVCEHLRDKAPGIEYTDGAIAKLTVVDPWKSNPDYLPPFVLLHRIKIRDSDRKITETYEVELKAA